MQQRTALHRWMLVVVVLVALLQCCAAQEAATNDNDDNDNNNKDGSASCTANDNNNDDDDATPRFVPDTCRVVMAPSTLPNAGWGVFVRGNNGKDRRQGQAILAGDVVIHVHDLDQANAAVQGDAAAVAGLKRLLADYAWDASVTGGFYEAPHRVVAVAAGLGMLANGLPSNGQGGVNALPFVPTVDEGGQTRLSRRWCLYPLS